MNNHKLLTTEQPLMLLPSLACEFGMVEAIFLQQLHYWLQKAEKTHDGKRWTFASLQQWSKQLPFISTATINRAITRLRKMGIVLVEKLANWKNNRTNYYSIQYDKLAHIAAFANSHDQAEDSLKPAILLDELSVQRAKNDNVIPFKPILSDCQNVNDIKDNKKNNNKNTRENFFKKPWTQNDAPQPIAQTSIPSITQPTATAQPTEKQPTSIGTPEPTIPPATPEQLRSIAPECRDLWRQLRLAKIDIAHDDPVLTHWINACMVKTIVQLAIAHVGKNIGWLTPSALRLPTQRKVA